MQEVYNPANVRLDPCGDMECKTSGEALTFDGGLIVSEATDWQPIGTAPKDGSYILAWAKDGTFGNPPHRDNYDFVFWLAVPKYPEGGWWTTEQGGGEWGEPTHWMPLPAPPVKP